MEWVQTLQLFVSAVQKGSLSGAARHLGCSPASASRHISALEERLGAQLLKRSSRSLALTDAGELYYRQAEAILRQLAEANESITQLHTRPSGTLRVHSRMLVGQLLVVPHLPEFLRRYPDITIDLVLSNNVASVGEKSTDVDIRIGRLKDSALVARKLAASERIVCATPAYLATRPPLRSPDDLRAHNCLTYRINLGPTVWRFMDQTKRVVEVPVRGNFQSDNGAALLELVRAGAGVALMPDWAIRHDLAAGRLTRLFPEYRVSHVEFENGVYAVFQKSKQTSMKLRLFVDFLVGVFRRELARPE